MGITEKVLLVLLGVFALLALLKLFAAPLKLTGKLLVNTLLGFALLGLLNVLGVLARLSLGLNLFNALVIAILGVPGLALLILLRLVSFSLHILICDCRVGTRQFLHFALVAGSPAVERIALHRAEELLLEVGVALGE